MFNTGAAVVYTCSMPPGIQYKPLNIFMEKGAGAGGGQAACCTLTASWGDAAALRLPSAGTQEEPSYFLKLNSLSLAVI